MVLDDFFNGIFGSLISYNPLYALLLISFIVTLFITLIYKFFTNQKELKRLKEESKELRNKMKENRGNPEKLAKLQKESLELSMKSMKQQFKPMIISFIPIIFIFGWLRNVYSPIGGEPIPLNLFGLHHWIWIYIIGSIIYSLILRKILRVH